MNNSVTSGCTLSTLVSMKTIVVSMDNQSVSVDNPVIDPVVVILDREHSVAKLAYSLVMLPVQVMVYTAIAMETLPVTFHRTLVNIQVKIQTSPIAPD